MLRGRSLARVDVDHAGRGRNEEFPTALIRSGLDYATVTLRAAIM